MLALVQRVREARVEIAGEAVGAIGNGLLVFVCAEPADTDVQADKLVAKLLKLRIFGDAAGKMNLGVQDVQGAGLLIVSQFTLAADTSGGNRPSFTGAAPAGQAQRLYDLVLHLACERHPIVACGRFGADMQVHLVNDGPRHPSDPYPVIETMIPAITKFDFPSTAPEVDFPREDRREIGAPERRTWVLYESAPAGLVAGIWECELGRWRIQMDPNEHEYMVVLAGRARLHAQDGAFTEVGPGEALVIPAGFAGSFEVLERLRKHFVIVVAG